MSRSSAERRTRVMGSPRVAAGESPPASVTSSATSVVPISSYLPGRFTAPPAATTTDW